MGYFRTCLSGHRSCSLGEWAGKKSWEGEARWPEAQLSQMDLILSVGGSTTRENQVASFLLDNEDTG